MTAVYCTKKRIVIWGLLIILAGSLSPVLASEPIVFGSIEKSPPLSYEENGVVKGYFPDMFREIARRAGYEIEIQLFPMKRIVAYLKAGRIDGAVHLIRTQERESFFFYSTTPILTGRSLVFIKKGKTLPFHSLSDLYGKKIGVPLGFKTMGPAFEKAVRQGNVIIEPVSGHEQNLKKLMAGRIDCLVATENITWYHAHRLGITGHIETLEPPLNIISVYFAISKQTNTLKNPQRFMESMNQALDAIIADGTSEKIMISYNLSAHTH